MQDTLRSTLRTEKPWTQLRPFITTLGRAVDFVCCMLRVIKRVGSTEPRFQMLSSHGMLRMPKQRQPKCEIRVLQTKSVQYKFTGFVLRAGEMKTPNSPHSGMR